MSPLSLTTDTPTPLTVTRTIKMSFALETQHRKPLLLFLPAIMEKSQRYFLFLPPNKPKIPTTLRIRQEQKKEAKFAVGENTAPVGWASSSSPRRSDGGLFIQTARNEWAGPVMHLLIQNNEAREALHICFFV